MKKISFIVFLAVIVFAFGQKFKSFETNTELEDLEIALNNIKPLLNNDNIIFYASNRKNAGAYLFKVKYAMAPFRTQKLKKSVPKDYFVLIVDNDNGKPTDFDSRLYSELYSKTHKGHHIKLYKKER